MHGVLEQEQPYHHLARKVKSGGLAHRSLATANFDIYRLLPGSCDEMLSVRCGAQSSHGAKDEKITGGRWSAGLYG
ncbi:MULTISPECIES: hypothetical protein [unclassified Mesorhizobium]|uniref:hypothetical protein n=1 Tax=unclassified Mesorhizobium TaxID=325217 RepID=UPI0012EB8DB3|nr:MULTISPECIES: hypothetical protein [unclassified Mesorhizobium]WJI80834.1 hypothetical protein NLY34_29145 [Mesorhizobium sp. C374B]WJI87373.1 hypothetical protein NLY42_31540 [Mesorhizobium sp. C372A]